MQRYGVYHLRDAPDPVIILQYPGLETSGLVIVAPLAKATSLPEIHPITPVLNIGDEEWLVLTYRMAAIPESDIEEMITQFDQADYVFQRALSRLFFGN